MHGLVDLRTRYAVCINSAVSDIQSMHARLDAVVLRLTFQDPHVADDLDLKFPEIVSARNPSQLRDAFASACSRIDQALIDLSARVRTFYEVIIPNARPCLHFDRDLPRLPFSKTDTICKLASSSVTNCANTSAIVSFAEKEVSFIEECSYRIFAEFGAALVSFNSSSSGSDSYQVTMTTKTLPSTTPPGSELTQWNSTKVFPYDPLTTMTTEPLSGSPAPMLYNENGYLTLPRYTVLNFGLPPFEFSDGFTIVINMRVAECFCATPLEDSQNSLLRFTLGTNGNGNGNGNHVVQNYARMVTRSLTFNFPDLTNAPAAPNEFVNTQMTLDTWGSFAISLSVRGADVVMRAFKNGSKVLSLTKHNAANAWNSLMGGNRTLSKIMLNGDPVTAYGNNSDNINPEDTKSGTETDVSAISVYDKGLSDEELQRLTNSVLYPPESPGDADADWGAPYVSPLLDLSASDIAADGPVAAWGALQQSNPARRPFKLLGSVVFPADAFLANPTGITFANPYNYLTIAIMFRRVLTTQVTGTEVPFSMSFKRYANPNNRVTYRTILRPNNNDGVDFEFGVDDQSPAEVGTHIRISFVDPRSWHSFVVRRDPIRNETRAWLDGIEYVRPGDAASYLDMTPNIGMGDSMVSIGRGYEFRRVLIFSGVIPTSSVATIMNPTIMTPS